MGVERVAHWCILALDRRASSTLRGRLSKHAVRTLCHGTRCHDQRHVHAICIGLSCSSEAFLFAARVASRVLARTARGRPWSRLRHAEGQPRGVSMTMTPDFLIPELFLFESIIINLRCRAAWAYGSCCAPAHLQFPKNPSHGQRTRACIATTSEHSGEIAGCIMSYFWSRSFFTSRTAL